MTQSPVGVDRRTRAGVVDDLLVLITDNFAWVDRYCIGPETGILTIKRSLTRPATHPQGAGQLDGKLISLKVANWRSGAAARTGKVMAALQWQHDRAAMQNLQPVGTQHSE